MKIKNSKIKIEMENEVTKRKLKTEELSKLIEIR